MAHTRLNSNSRLLLLCLMEKIVDCPAEEKAKTSAYVKALPVAKALVEARFPASDMAILSKYDCVEKEHQVRIQLYDGSVIQFEFAKDDELSFPKYKGGMFLADKKQSDLLEHWRNAFDAFRKVLNEKRTDYRNFINSAATFEQVVEIWPEASQLSGQIKTNLPANVGQEVLARITADSKKRMKRAA